MLRRAWLAYCLVIWQIVCSSVTLSVCNVGRSLVDCDHTSWNSPKINSLLVSIGSFGCALSADKPNSTIWIYYKRKTPEILAETGVGIYGKVAFGVQKLFILISLKRGKIGPRLLLRTNRKSPTRFRLVPKFTTLDDLEWSLHSVSKHVLGLWFFTLHQRRPQNQRLHNRGGAEKL